MHSCAAKTNLGVDTECFAQQPMRSIALLVLGQKMACRLAAGQSRSDHHELGMVAPLQDQVPQTLATRDLEHKL